MPLTEAALARARELDEPLAEPLARYLEEHVDEELGHDETLLGDLELLGVDRANVLERMPSPAVAALVGGQYYWILHYHPVAFLGYVALMEGYPPTPELIESSSARPGIRAKPSAPTSSTPSSTRATATGSTGRSIRSRSTIRTRWRWASRRSRRQRWPRNHWKRSSSRPERALGYTAPPMAGERVKLQVQERDSRGSAESRRLRKQGLIPGVLYGRGKTPHPISIPERELRRVLTGGQGLHAILDVTLENQKTTHPSILKEYQQHPVKGGIIHVDLQEVRLDQPIQARVVVELTGEPVGVTEGGVLSQVNREITVEALPMEIPEHLELDVSGMAIGDTLRLVDLPVQEGVVFLDDPEETVLATVTMPTRIVEPEPEEGEELEEGELPEGEVPEGEEAPAEGEEAAEDAGADSEGDSGSTEG